MTISNLRTREDRQPWLESVWSLLVAAYQSVPGGLHFESASALLEATCRWDLAFDDGEVLAVIIYKQRHGLKISAFARNPDRRLKQAGKQSLIEMMTHSLAFAWVEVSDGAEPFVLCACGGEDYVIPNTVSVLLMKHPVSLCHDGKHYTREILGIAKRKLVVGTPCYNTMPIRIRNRATRMEPRVNGSVNWPVFI